MCDGGETGGVECRGLGVLSSSRGRGRGRGQKSLTCSELWRRQRLSRLSTVRLTARKRVAKRARTRERRVQSQDPEGGDEDVGNVVVRPSGSGHGED